MQTIGGREPLHGELGRFYDAIENPRKTRGELPILRDAELRAYMADVRERTLEVLDEVELGADAEDPLLRDGFVYEMLLAHEHQHNETMLQLLQMVDGYEPRRESIRPPAGDAGRRRPGDGRGRGGRVRDRRRRRRASPTTTSARRHTVELAAFEIDRTPVTNGAYVALHRGDRRRAADVLGARRRGGWVRRAMGRREPIDPAIPSSTSPGTRPTPSPAGPASGCRPSTSGRRRGRGSTASATAWEWTSSDFLAYPGFEAFPYPEYSEVFFGDAYKVLRGGSWATHPRVVRPSFRNWDLPQRRQIFAGLRCARDA